MPDALSPADQAKHDADMLAANDQLEARGAYDAFNMYRGGTLPKFDQLPDDLKAVWLNLIKAMRLAR